ncbi:hypothetical protein ACIBH1_10865 [Nonomuraea sp. NPDC050663]|uniref:hypothetical protein n=1 Tax=Nonomuraea sp. NPDC050663 TaxID=3364370 RepID=UPI003794232D
MRSVARLALLAMLAACSAQPPGPAAGAPPRGGTPGAHGPAATAQETPGRTTAGPPEPVRTTGQARDPAGAVVTTPGGSRYDARPLTGAPFPARTGLRLLLSPALEVLDVDSGGRRPVMGVPPDPGRWLESAGGLAVTRSLGKVYTLRKGSLTATDAGPAADIEPAADGRSVWLTSTEGCTTHRADPSGAPRTAPRRVPCNAVTVDDVPAGLLLWLPEFPPSSLLLPARAGEARPLPWLVDGVVGGDLVLSAPSRGKPVTLADLGTGRSTTMPWPSRIGAAGRIVASGGAGRAAVAFYDADPAPWLAVDVWLLDVAERRWRQLPGMPVRLARKPYLAWTSDGRLLILATNAGEADATLASWDGATLRVKKLTGLSADGFVLW